MNVASSWTIASNCTGPNCSRGTRRANSGGAWRELFGEYDMAQALIHVDSPLLPNLSEAGWIECYADAAFVVMAASCN